MAVARHRILSAVLIGLAVASTVAAQQPVRVATYNIKFFKSSVSAPRLANLKEVVAALDADIIGLQEIDDRAALERLFDTADWDLVIDDQSGDDQDVAVAIRHPFKALGLSAGLDANDEHFLFPGSANDQAFPNRRDLLCVEVSVPGESQSLFFMVHHAKSRLGGRGVTDPRREAAARAMIARLEQDFDGRRYVLVGDCNDNPDDRSMNILEAGQPDAAGGAEQIEGPFLLNLCEELVAQDRVSWGLKSNDIANGLINTVEPGSRQRNNAERGGPGSVSPILFDQILIPVTMKAMYVPGSAKVFDHPAALLGGANAPSDHVPVFADLVLGEDDDSPDPDGLSGLVIVELFPDPQGDDRGREEVVLLNAGSSGVALDGWRLRDRAGNVFALSGTLAANVRVTIVLPAHTLPLNNGGDDVALVDPDGTIVHQVTYGSVDPGERVTFP